MKLRLECIPCFFYQALRAGQITNSDEKTIKQMFDEIGMMIKDITFDSTSPEIAAMIYEKIGIITNNKDPYRELKRKSTEQSLVFYPFLKRKVEESEDKLFMAIRIAIAGNIIDFGVNSTFDLDREINEVFDRDFAICDYEQFKNRLKDAQEIIYIGDNAGECVFDRILIEEMKKPVTYVVRDVPVINDVTYEDAVHAGIDDVAKIMSSGTHAPGTVLHTCSEEFRESFKNASFIISKGQGNYEALSDEIRPIFFLLKAKCEVIARVLGVNKGDLILKGIRGVWLSG